MAKQTINNSESGLITRGKLNDNYTELYDKNTTQDASIAGNTSDLATHEAGVANPHVVTKTQVGLGSVDNTSDAEKLLKCFNTGILTGCIPSLNADITKIDISSGTYVIQGVYYIYAGVTGYTPNLQVGETARRIGVDASGLVDQSGKFTSTQKQTILPICRIQAIQGQSGSGSDLLTPLHTHYHIGEEGYFRRLWHEEAIGVLYHTGGVISESSTARQIDESSGSFYNAQSHRLTISGSSDILAIPIYHVAGSWTTGTDAVLVVDNLQFDNGTDLTTLANNKWASHTLLKSPKEEDNFFFVYSQAEYASQAEAEAAEPSYGVFQSQSFSGLVAVAQLIIQKSATNINQIKDARPFIGGNVGAILGTSNLQQTYDNSTSPEINTDATRGALTVKENTADDTANVYEGKNNASTTTFSVDGNGLLFTTGLPTYADDAAAGTGGLTTGYVYKTATGEVRIKL
ncbi:hypothetical protein KAU11_08180 [Candidatus Babeliales bacterium]|nr:hypothetical protein [Candidatus Babeliales bacterium]